MDPTTSRIEPDLAADRRRGYLGVFGSLRRGQPNHDEYLSDGRRCRYVGTGTIRGSLHEVPAGLRDPSVSYPYPLHAPGGPGSVVVEVYEILDPELFDELDELESISGSGPDSGPEYQRQMTPVVLDGHPEIERVWVYEYATPPAEGLVTIPSGDWVAHLRS